MTLFANLLILEAIVYCGGEHYYLKGRNIVSILFKRLSTVVLGLLSCSDGAEAHFTTCPFQATRQHLMMQRLEWAHTQHHASRTTYT